MTPTTIQAAARRKYNATGDTFFDDDEFFHLLFEAESVLAEEAMVIENRYTTSTVASQREYAWPTRALAIRRIELDGVALQYTTFPEDDGLTLFNQDTTDTGTPSYYQIWNRTIFLRPIPSAASSNGLVIYTYDYPTLQTTASATLDSPVVYHKDLVNFIVANMASKDGNLQVAQYYDTLWAQAVLRAKKWRNKRSSLGPRMVKNADIMPGVYRRVY